MNPVILYFLIPLLIVPPAMTKDSTGFSEAEIYQALVQGMPEGEARRMAAEFSHPERGGSYSAGLPTPRPGEVAVAYSEDLLIALSLVSEETNRKVDEYRLSRSNGKISPAEQRSWEARRSRFREMLRASHQEP